MGETEILNDWKSIKTESGPGRTRLGTQVEQPLNKHIWNQIVLIISPI